MSNLKLNITNLFLVISLWLMVIIFTAKQALATVQINEIMPNPVGNESEGTTDKEWVELFNDADGLVSLVGWKLVDKAGHEKTLDGLVGIDGKGFKIYETDGSWMNNGDGDVIKLINTAGVQEGFEFAYGSDPGEGVTLGRYPDGAVTWATMQSVTKGNTNSGPIPVATATPTQTPTPSVSPTPVATATPTSGLTPTRIPVTPTPKIKSQEDDTQTKPTENPTDIDKQRSQVLAGNNQDEVVEVGNSTVDNQSGTPSGEGEKGSGIDWLVLGLIGGGSLLLAGAGWTVWKSNNQ